MTSPSNLANFPVIQSSIGVASGPVAIWAGWIVATRDAVAHTLEPAALALLRFAIPALVFSRVWWGTGLRPRGLSWPTMAALTSFGAPFFLVAGYTMQITPAPDVGPLLSLQCGPAKQGDKTRKGVDRPDTVLGKLSGRALAEALGRATMTCCADVVE